MKLLNYKTLWTVLIALLSLLVGLIVLAFERPRLVREVSPQAPPLEEHEWGKWGDTYGRPYRTRGLY